MPNLRQDTIYEFEDFRLDAAHRLLYRKGDEISLTPKAVETLLALVEGQGEVIGKNDLMQKIWGDTIVEESNLAQYLHVLRKTLGLTHDGTPFIETLKRRGYRFNGSAVKNERGSVEIVPATNGARTKHEAPIGFPVPGSNSIVRYLLAIPRGAFFAIAAILGVLLIAAFWFEWLRSPAQATNQEVTAKGDLTILPLTNGEAIGQATISFDGKYFAYAEYDTDVSRLWLQQVGESSRIEIAAPFPGRILSLTFNPDSSAIYFTASHTPEKFFSLYRIPTLGGVAAKILADLGQAVSFSPDGAEMVFVRKDPENDESKLVIAASDGTHERILLARDGAQTIVGNASWSPNGKLIAFGLINHEAQAVSVCSIVGIDPAGSEIRQLSSEKWDNCYRTAWTRDGEGLVFIGTKYREALTTRRDQVYYVTVATGTARRLTNDGNWHETMTLETTDAGDILALPFNRVSQIWSLDAGGDMRTARQITKGQSDGRGGIAPLPSGKIAFLSRAGDGFGIFQSDDISSDHRNQIAFDPTMEELRGPSDGSFLIFSAKVDGNSQLFRVGADGSNRQQLTFGENNAIDSTVSPSGKWIVYAFNSFAGGKSRYELQKIPAAGGKPTLLLNEPCFAPHFSPNELAISCVEGARIRVISFEDGKTLKRFDTAGYAVLNTGARWSPDGQYLIYRVSEKDATNLWRQPIQGGEATKLTEFTNGDIYNFAYSMDGTRLYLAFGNQIRNAILIKNFR